MIISLYLLKFYVDVVGLDPIAVATLFLVAKIIDAVNDPITGFIIDHLPPKKMGRFRPYLLIGTIICSLNFALLFFGPSLAPTGKLVIAYITYLLIGVTYDIMDISSNSLLPVMAKQGKERDSLSLIKSIGSLVGGLTFSILPALIIGLFPSQPPLGYYVLIIIAVVFVLILSIIGTLGVKERVQPIEKEKYHAREIFKILGAAPVFTYFIAMLILGLGTGSFFTSFAFFAQYVFNNPLLVAAQALVGLVGQIIGLSIGRAIIGRLGRKNLQILGMLIGFVPIIFILLIPLALSMLIYVVFIINGIGTGMYGVVGYGLQADNIDFVEWKQGHRTEGAVTSLTTFVQKAGMGIGSAIPGFILGMTGYIPNAAVQPPDAILGIKWAYVIFPTICAVISIVFFWIFYPITKEKNALIASELAARHK